MEPFPIGFWNYMPVERLDAESVKDWADAGMTLTMGPESGPEPERSARLRAILDAARERNIRVIVCDRRSYWKRLMRDGAAAYREGMEQAVRDFGDHPAVFGFHVGDEPKICDFEPACEAVRIQKQIAPHLTPFVNLLPRYDGVELRVGWENWPSYLDAFATTARPDLLCYDCYGQMAPGADGINQYFYNLREFHAAGKRHGIPFWTTLLSVGHYSYRCPNEDDLRWQLNTAIAHGARGILWFFFYLTVPHDNFRLSPIDEHGERTETFRWLSRTNRTFLKSVGEIVQDLALQKVSHFGKNWGGVPLFDGSGLVSRARTSQDAPLIISEFKHRNGSDYIMVVNNSQTTCCRAELWVRGRQPRLHHVRWGNREAPVEVGDRMDSEQGFDFVMVKPRFAPGQMELFRLENTAP